MSAGPARPVPPLSPGDWEEFLSARLSRRVRVAYGRSRTNPLQARRPRLRRTEAAFEGSVAWLVRLHSMFAAAPIDVRTAVADLLRAGRGAGPSRAVLESWISDALAKLPSPAIPDAALERRGCHHDLGRIADELFASDLREDFGEGRPAPRMTWGRTSSRRTRRGMRLGSYDADVAIVRIHPALDQPAVPDWFVRYVLFHEFLHAVHPPVRGRDGRWVRHGEAFRGRERAYRDLERALAWERRHIDALIRSARTGKPLRSGRGAERPARGSIQRLLFPD